MVLHRYVSYVLLFVVLLASESHLVSTGEESKGLDEFKLDRILEQLAHISSRQDEIFRITSNKDCFCCNERLKVDSNGVRKSEPEVTRFNRKRDHSSSTGDFVSGINKLADENNHENSLNGWFSLPVADPNSSINLNDDRLKIIMLSLGQQYEAVFGDALSNLQNILKEQLTSFSLTLRKLMNKSVDHSYQYNTILNQLTYLKEECSLAVSTYNSLNLSNLVSPVVVQASEINHTNEVKNVLRTSDLTLIARTLSDQIEKAIGSSRESSSSTASANNEDLNDLHKMSLEEMAELKGISTRLSQIDSVVKQSALFLSQLNGQIVPILQTNVNLSAQKGNQQTIVVTNNPADIMKQPESNFNSSVWVAESAARLAQLSSASPTSRWFTGSKVPGNKRNPADQSSTAAGLTRNNSKTVRRCQSRTSLVTPSSCQQLRQAGANCTGQYYVFIRGSIRYVYCDMNMLSEDDGGGWTVILRRIDKSIPEISSNGQPQQKISPSNHLMESMKASQLNFNLDWFNYRNGFGYLDDWAEFFIGLDLLHQISLNNAASPTQLDGVSNPLNATTTSLSWSNQTELQIDLEAHDGTQTHIKYESFYLEGENTKFRLQLAGCNSTKALCSRLDQLNNASFYTFDTLDRKCANGPFGGWWLPAEAADPSSCLGRDLSAFSLTKPIEAKQGKHLFWQAGSGYPDDSLPLRRLVLKVRRRRQV